MKFFSLFLILCIIAFNPVQSKEIYKWLDAEGVKQFSNKPPPLSCQTPSCIKLNKKIAKNLKMKREAELSRIEAEKIQRQEEKKKPVQKKTVNNSEPEDISAKTFLPTSTVMCESFNSIKEFSQVPKARIHLERDNACNKTIEETEYTIIERQDKYSNIRIYLTDGSSRKKWVETRFLLD